jgi:hypothetical protein
MSIVLAGLKSVAGIAEERSLRCLGIFMPNGDASAPAQ